MSPIHHTQDISISEPITIAGAGPETLDTGLLKQALELGVEVRFNSRLNQLDEIGLLAAGPKVPDAIAGGCHFETSMDDGFWVICSDVTCNHIDCHCVWCRNCAV